MLPYNQSAQEVLRTAQWFLSRHNSGIEFKLDDDIKRLYRLLTLYFTNNPDFELYSLNVSQGKIMYSLKKGILLIGPTGRSKSFCFEKVFRTFTNKHMPDKSFRCVNSQAIQMAFETEGVKALNSFRRSKAEVNDNVYIDEIGMEELSVQHYGNKQSPLQTFLYERHRLFTSTDGKYITHASSNLKLMDNEQIDFKKAYGDRIYSRLFEMFNIIITNGSDLRINIIPD